MGKPEMAARVVACVVVVGAVVAGWAVRICGSPTLMTVADVTFLVGWLCGFPSVPLAGAVIADGGAGAAERGSGAGAGGCCCVAAEEAAFCAGLCAFVATAPGVEAGPFVRVAASDAGWCTGGMGMCAAGESWTERATAVVAAVTTTFAVSLAFPASAIAGVVVPDCGAVFPFAEASAGCVVLPGAEARAVSAMMSAAIA
jgi:hypothetical protein